MPIVERSIELDGRKLAWREAGAGWPVVLLHPFPLSSRVWEPQLERVPDGWRFIAPDFRGFGASAPTRDGEAPAPLTMDDYAREVGALMDCLEIDSAVVGGLSMGGYVAFAMLRQLAARFAGLVLADTRATADTPQQREGRQRMRAALGERGPSAVADLMIPTLLSDGCRARRPELVSHVRGIIEGAQPAAIDAAIAAMMTRPDSTPDLAHISCGVLVLVGERDAITPPADAERMQQAIARATLVMIPDAGHLSNLEQPDVFLQALADFLVAHQ